MEYRKFGKTGIDMPVISCGGMRYQQSWNGADEVTPDSDANVQACVRRALELGINHIETARGYGTSEKQLGKILPELPRDELIVQTKVAPFPDVEQFEDTFEESMGFLGLEYVDLLGLHGVNNGACLDNAMRCMEAAQRWKKEGRVRHIGFSTHAACEDIIAALDTGAFEYVNLHWYYIFQDNWPAVERARELDMGVFIISPSDKGGMLYRPTPKLVELTAPLHPMAFNDLFCLMRPEVHTLSCGAAVPSDLDPHAEAVKLLDRAHELVPPIVERLEGELRRVLGQAWAATWKEGLPAWHETPGDVNVPVILQLYTLAKAFDMVEYGKMRYNLLGNGGHWFPGRNAAELDRVDLGEALSASPHAAAIPARLAETDGLLGGEARARLQES